MDLLDDIFNTLNLKGALYFRTDFSAPWGVTVPELGGAARFHLVIQGRCHIRVNQQHSLELTAGDLILIPRGMSHVLAHSGKARTPPLEKVLADNDYTGDGILTVGAGDPRASTQMVCGHFTFRDQAKHPILDTLPDYLLMSNSCRAKHTLLDEVLRLIARRIFDDQLGSAASVTRLSEIVFIELLRSGLGDATNPQPFLTALDDPKIGKSLQLIHTEPESAWTVETLASQVAMSRSRFAHRFNQLVGLGPMAYLSDWRLQKALSLLDDSRLSVQQVASQTGYRSASAFTRAFSGKFGVAPTEYRHSLN